ncbi:MAG TPA: hypothetical protein VI385_03045 [Flavisolibacter sp.]
MKKYVIASFVVVTVVACSAKTFTPSSEQFAKMQQKVPGITLEEANAGSKIYSGKCARCHRLYAPDKYTVAQWDKILPKMLLKVQGLSNEQQRQVADYLHAMSK